MRFAYPPYGPEPGILENYPRIFLKSQIFVYYSPVIPLISGNPVTNISLIFLDRFVQDLLGNELSILCGRVLRPSRIWMKKHQEAIFRFS